MYRWRADIIPLSFPFLSSPPRSIGAGKCQRGCGVCMVSGITASVTKKIHAPFIRKCHILVPPFTQTSSRTPCRSRSVGTTTYPNLLAMFKEDGGTYDDDMPMPINPLGPRVYTKSGVDEEGGVSVRERRHTED